MKEYIDIMDDHPGDLVRKGKFSNNFTYICISIIVLCFII